MICFVWQGFFEKTPELLVGFRLYSRRSCFVSRGIAAAFR